MITALTDDVRTAVRLALAEDHAGDDVTTQWTVPSELWVRGHVESRAAGTIAGLAAVEEVYRQLDDDVQVQPHLADGDRVLAGDHVLSIAGPARSIVTGERVALNFLQRMSGIATSAAAYVERVRDLPVVILDTRKTVPGLRALDKYAVTCGGATNHRRDLSAMVLVKENHLAAAGGVEAAVDGVRRGAAARSDHIQIEVEVTDVAQALAALRCGVDWALLDNMTPEQLRTVAGARNRTLAYHRTRLEASGNVELDSVRRVALTGVDAISVGALTHSPAALDLSMLVAPVATTPVACCA
jgi:nicotinate-nucleotide pyrophosphorylase (carboxylating)